MLSQRKSAVRTPAEARALAIAVEAIRGVPVTNPLFLDGEPVGWLRSDHTREVWFAPWTGINDMIVSFVAGQTTRRSWCKQLGALSPITLKWTDLWCVGGKPQAGTYTGTANTSKAFDDTIAGGLAHGGNVSPKQKIIKDGWINSIGGAGLIWAYDRTLAYESWTTTNGTTTLTQSATMGRYNGSGLPGCLVMPTVQNALTVGPNLTAMVYVDQAGSSSSAPLSTAYALDTHVATQTNLIGSGLALVNAGNGAIPFVPLAAGDTGVRSITSVTANGAETGTVCLACIRPLVMLANSAPLLPAQYDYVHQIPCLDDIVYDGAHISFLSYIQTAAQQFCMGGLSFGWG